MKEAQSCQEFLSTLADKCQSVARTLSYNDGPAEASAKHVLREASHALDTCIVRVYKCKVTKKMMIANARGKEREMTWRERASYSLLGTTKILV